MDFRCKILQNHLINPAAIVDFVAARPYVPTARIGVNLDNVHPSLSMQIFRHLVKVLTWNLETAELGN